MVEDYLREARNSPEEQILDGRVARARDRDAAAVATHSGEPKCVYLLERLGAKPWIGVQLDRGTARLFRAARNL